MIQRGIQQRIEENHRRMEAIMQQRDLEDLAEDFNRFQVSPVVAPVPPRPVQEEKELVYEPCPMCFNKVEESKVTLGCGCEYHLNCFLIIQNETHCIKCGDKINKTEEDYEECSICLEKIKSGDHKTKCGHHFHKHCIGNWMRIRHNCPNCRADI